jgi:hypothetical protein
MIGKWNWAAYIFAPGPARRIGGTLFKDMGRRLLSRIRRARADGFLKPASRGSEQDTSKRVASLTIHSSYSTRPSTLFHD